MKGTWSILNSAYQLIHAQADIDQAIRPLIKAINTGTELVKEHAPLKGRYSPDDLIVRDLLREIIKGANVVKVYCEKRPSSA